MDFGPSGNPDQQVTVINSPGRLAVNIHSQWLQGAGARAKIEVYNLTGRKVKELFAGAGNTGIDLPGGQVYIFRIAANDRQVIKKVVAQ